MQSQYSRRLRATWFLMLSSVFLSCAATRYSSAPPPWQNELEGAWRVQFTGSVRVQLPIEFSPAHDGGVADVIVLSNAGIRFRDAKWRNGQLRMKASTPQGDMNIDARLEGDRMVGEWAADHPVGKLMIKGSLEGVRIPDGALGPIRGTAVFDSVWSLVNAGHFDPSLGGVDWNAVRDELRPRAEVAPSDGAAFLVISEMLQRLPTSHTSFYPVLTAPGAGVAAAVTPPIVSWRALSPTTGYVRIAHFTATGRDLDRATAQLDSAFAALGQLPAILVDLRDNPGGNAGLAAALAGHLARDPVRVGVFASRAGLTRHGVRSIDDLAVGALPVLTLQSADAHRQQDAMMELGGAVLVAVGGTRSDAYDGVVGVLVNRGTHSTAEAVAAALGESGRATVLGTRTAGEMLAGRAVEVAHGWRLMWPEYDYRTASGASLEGAGVRPHVEITGSGDDVLQRAHAWLRNAAR